MRLMSFALLLNACGPAEDSDTDVPADTGTPDTDVPLDLINCESNGVTPEVFLGRGVGGAFALLEEGAQANLISAPQGGQGVSVLLGTRGLQAGLGLPEVSISVTGVSAAVENSTATFDAVASLECKSDGPDGPQGVVYGIVIGFASSLGNSDLLLMNGQVADLSVTITDSLGATASVVHPVTLIVGE